MVAVLVVKHTDGSMFFFFPLHSDDFPHVRDVNTDLNKITASLLASRGQQFCGFSFHRGGWTLDLHSRSQRGGNLGTQLAGETETFSGEIPRIHQGLAPERIASSS